MITKTGRDLPVLEITAENYAVPKGEERYVHAKIEIKQFNPKTGARISKPRIQVFGRKAWKSIVKESLIKQGYDIEVLHNPETWIKENAAARTAQKLQSEQARRNAEKEAMKREIIAELIATGVIPTNENPGKKEPKGKKNKESNNE